MTDEVGEVTVLEKSPEVSAPLSPESTETQRKQTLYDTYRERGGIFGKEIFDTLTSLTQKELEGRKAGESTTFQAKSLARIANITLSPREMKWYEYLRELPPAEPASEKNERGEEVDPARIGDQKVLVGDQELLAEVLRIGDTEKYKKFTAAFPEVFGKPKE